MIEPSFNLLNLLVVSLIVSHLIKQFKQLYVIVIERLDITFHAYKPTLTLLAL